MISTVRRCACLPASFRHMALFFGIFVLAHMPALVQAQPPQAVESFDVGTFMDDRMTATWASYSDVTAQLLDLRWRVVGDVAWLGGVELEKTDPPAYTVTGLLEGTQYEFSIQAMGTDQRGYSLAATALGETLFGTQATNVRASSVGERRVTVSWSLATSPTVVSQKVYVSWDGGLTYRFNTAIDQGPLLGNTITSLEVPSLTPMSDYHFLVETLFVGAGGAIRSRPSSIISTLPAAPAKVANVQALYVQTTSLQLFWGSLVGRDDIGADVVSYSIEVREGDAPFPDPGPFVLQGANTFQVNGLLRNQEYRIRITALNEKSLASIPSDVVVVTTLSDNPLPPGEPSVQVTAEGLLVTWAPLVTNQQTGGNPITRYTVHRRREDELVFDVGVDAGVQTSLLITQGLTPNYLYEIAISATTVQGTSRLSPPSKPTLPPQGPVLLKPTAAVSRDADGSVITLSWTPPMLSSNVIAYRSYMREVRRTCGGCVPYLACLLTYWGVCCVARWRL